MLTKYFTRDSFIGKLSTFETSRLQDALPKVESTFKAQVTHDGSKRKKKRKYVESDNESYDDLDELESLLARRLPREKENTKATPYHIFYM